jgi:hypothetical protein
MKTQMAVILDRSGSMNEIKYAMEIGFNEVLESQRRLDDDFAVSLYQFDDKYEVVYENLKIANVPRLQLVPRGMTALNDAIGTTINKIKNSHKNQIFLPDQVLVVIITDGYENASREFKKTDIRSLISGVKESIRPKWDFIFLGANQDAVLSGQDYGIAYTNSMTYNSSDTGIRGMSVSLDSYLSTARTAGVSSFAGFSDEERDTASK